VAIILRYICWVPPFVFDESWFSATSLSGATLTCARWILRASMTVCGQHGSRGARMYQTTSCVQLTPRVLVFRQCFLPSIRTRNCGTRMRLVASIGGVLRAVVPGMPQTEPSPRNASRNTLALGNPSHICLSDLCTLLGDQLLNAWGPKCALWQYLSGGSVRRLRAHVRTLDLWISFEADQWSSI